MKELLKIQAELKVPKNQYNSFGKYNYRNCEDILEAVKPLLIKYDVIMTVSDEVINLSDRFYIQATATLIKDSVMVVSRALARESESRKGMDESQITGTASSYARKRALEGLFLLDDTKDTDSMKTPAEPDYVPTSEEISIMKEAVSYYTLKGNQGTANKYKAELANPTKGKVAEKVQWFKNVKAKEAK